MKQNSGHPWHTAKKNRYRNLFLKILSGALAFALAAPLCSVTIAALPDGECPHHPEHTADCGYQPAAEGSPCAHEHSEGCEFIEGTEGSCAHIHDENCGFAEAAAEIPCAFACDICDAKLMGTEEDADAADKTPAPMAVASWSWESDYLEWNEEGGFWGLGMPGAGEEGNVTPAMLAEEYLPAEILAVLADGAEETLALQWDFGGLPEEGAAAGSYQLTAALPEGYTLGETAQEIQVQLEIGGGETYGDKYKFFNQWNFLARDGSKMEQNKLIAAIKDLSAKSSDEIIKILKDTILPNKLRGWVPPDNSADPRLPYLGFIRDEDQSEKPYEMTKDGPVLYKYAYIWGSVNIDWKNFPSTFEDGSTFTLVAYIPPKTENGHTYLGHVNSLNKEDHANNIGDTTTNPDILSFEVTIRDLNPADHIVAPANPANVTVNLFDYWAKTKEPTEASNGDILPKNDNHFHEEGGEGALGNTPTKYSTKDDWNVGINKGHLLLFGDGMIHAGLWNKAATANSMPVWKAS